jgi:uncharacterized protein
VKSAIFEITKYDFNSTLTDVVADNRHATSLWPLVYILSNDKMKEAYVGETTDALSRMNTHLKHNVKSKLTAVHLITSEKFNKSATLDIEANLIKFISGDGQYKLQNANLGLAHHTYYQKSQYWEIFKSLWDELRLEGVTKNSLDKINNSDLFKYSPYKSLTPEQKSGLIVLIKALIGNSRSLIMEGGAGTGKTILATFLFKLLNTDLDQINYSEFGEEEEELINLVRALKKKYPQPKMALVVPMASFRSTLKKVFKNIKGLSAKMVIGPAEVVNEQFDLLIVDESHRLRRRVNLGTYFGVFDSVCRKLNFDPTRSSELDWILRQGKKQVLFYDSGQSIKPSDVKKTDFDRLRSAKETTVNILKSQFRVRGGNDYIDYVNRLLNCEFGKNQAIFHSDTYEFEMFDSLEEMISRIKKKNSDKGLSRLIAGYSWEWISKKDSKKYDINIDTIKLRWNSIANDWVNSPGAINEVGCIHTTQGYDLNYAGIIFGNEISFDKSKNEIVIKPEEYFDKNGKQTIKDPAQLKEFIINIYKTILKRGIEGTYVYACDKNLRDYLAQYISSHKAFETIESSKIPDHLTIVSSDKVIPFKNSIPLFDTVKIAAGSFGWTPNAADCVWVSLSNYKSNHGDFVCQVTGESMNKIIPNGSWCLFKKDDGGSRQNKIVIVRQRNIEDKDFGQGLTIKRYYSEKEIRDDGWRHKSIELRPESFDPKYKDIILDIDDTTEFDVIGIFVRIL